MAQLQHRRMPHSGDRGRTSITRLDAAAETKVAQRMSKAKRRCNGVSSAGKKAMLGIVLVYLVWIVLLARDSTLSLLLHNFNALSTASNPSTMVQDATQSALGSLYDPPKSQNLNDPQVREAFGSRATCLKAIRQRHDEVFGNMFFHKNHPKQSQNTPLSSMEILLIDPAYHPNVGDHMITVGEQVFLQKVILNWTRQRNSEQNNPPFSIRYHECSYLQARKYAPPCSKVISSVSTATHASNDQQLRVAIWHGGGNWGDLWPQIQQLRTTSLRLLQSANYTTTIIGMPQSLYFSNAQIQADNAKEWNSALLSQQQSLWTWREHESYQLAQTLYPHAKHQLVPDIAFQLGPYLRTNAESADNEDADIAPVDFLFLLRNDHESIHSPYRDRRTMTELLDKLSYSYQSSTNNDHTRRSRRISFSIVDWPDRLDRFSRTEEPDPNFLFTETAVQLLRMGRVVICDRLHAAILAYLCGQSLVYVDQVSGKLTKTLRVAMESDPASCHADMWRNVSYARSSRSQPSWWARGHNLTHAIQTAMEILSVVVQA